MSSRTRSKAGRAAPSPPSLASLPDELLLLCLQPLSQEERFRSVALVSKRFQQLCLAPQLLRRLRVWIHGDARALPRTTALLQFSMQQAAHVRHLTLDIQPARAQPDSQQQELAALVASTLAAFGAAGSLQNLAITQRTPLASMAWLPALQQLQSIRLGNERRLLRLPAAVSRLTALTCARLWGNPMLLEGQLPPSLAWLCIEDRSSTEAPHQMSQLSALTFLRLFWCKYSTASLACLSTLTNLRRLHIAGGHSLPACLPSMACLDCLAAIFIGSSEQAIAWQATLGAALPRLTCLSTLLLSEACGPSDLATIAQLPRLQRLWLRSETEGPLPSPAPLAGPWLTPLRWLALQWEVLERAVGPLRAAPHLEYVCSLTMPARTDKERWHAAWEFLATHPPLRRFHIESSDSPSLPVFDAVIALCSHRPALHVSRIGHSGTASSSSQLLSDPCVPSVLY